MTPQCERGACVSTEALDRACEAALKAIEKELPKEDIAYGVYSTVIEKCAERLWANRFIEAYPPTKEEMNWHITN